MLFLTNSALSFSQIKVIGYLPTYRWEKLRFLDYDHMTHLCAAFANPDDSGNLMFEKDLNVFVSFVRSKGVSALISIGGGGDFSWGDKHKVYKELLKTQDSRTAFVHKIMNFVREYNLDGVDNDMEGYALELENYNVFSQELGDSLHAQGYEFTAALGVGGQWGVDLLAPETMERYDFIMTMSYGGVGSWNWKEKPDDGTYEKMVKDVNYLISKGYDSTKCVGGVPFYATEFPATEQTSYWMYNISNCDVYEKYAKQQPWNKDTVYSSQGHPIYINSIETLKKKLDFGISKGSGIMIWEVGQDCFSGANVIMEHLGNHMDDLGINLDVSGLSRHVKIIKKGDEVNFEVGKIGVQSIRILLGSEELFSTRKSKFKVGPEFQKKGSVVEIELSQNKIISLSDWF